MEITINGKVIDILRNEGFYPDTMFSLYFALKALQEKEIGLLDRFDDLNASKRAVVLYQTLYRKGLLEKSEDTDIYFKPSAKGIELLEALKVVGLTNDIIEKAERNTPTCGEWIEEWVNLFPVKSGTRLLRGDKKSCAIKMDKFLKTYNYSKEVIFQATKSYLMEESTRGFRYTKNAVYFINKKDEGSQLAAWCKVVSDKIEAGENPDDGAHIGIADTVN